MKSLKDIFKINKQEKIEIEPSFLNDFLKLVLTKDGERVDIFSYNNDIYKFFLESDIFDLNKNENYIIIKYDDLYEIDEEYFEFFNLPPFFEGYIKIENETNFLNKNGVKFNYKLLDEGSEYIIKSGNVVQRNKILDNHPENRWILYKEQYDLIKSIKLYNHNEKNKIPFEQYKILNKIKNSSEKTNIILNDKLKNTEEIRIIDKIIIDFIENEKGNFDLLPVIESLSEEENEVLQKNFKNNKKVKDYYTININGQNIKIVLNTPLKKNTKKIKEISSITKKELINGEIDNDISDNIEFNWGERVKGLGYLPYRPSPPQNISDINWFDKSFPSIFHDEGSIKLTPDQLPYLKQKYDSMNDNDKTELDLIDNGEKKKILIDKENLGNEIKKLENATINDFTKIKSEKFLNKAFEKMKNSNDKYVEIDGKYVKNYEDKSIIEEYINKFKKDKLETKTKKSDKKEKVLLIKDNLEEDEYKEELSFQNLDINDFQKPSFLKDSTKLYVYQKEGVIKLQSLYNNSKINGMLLCDDMGLGKTLQILTFLSWIKEFYILSPSLVVLPTSLIDNWKEEMKKFFDPNTFSIDFMQGNVPLEKIEEFNDKDIIITTYESLRMNHVKTAKIKWKVIICDEAQKMKNPKTLLTTAIKSQNVEFKIACTATPIENSLQDLWCLTDFVKPGILGNLKDFSKKYIKNRKNTEHEMDKLNKELQQKLDYFYLRRTKDEALKDENFPKKIIKYNKVKLSEKQIEKLNLFNTKAEEGASVLAIIQGMLMNCSHPRLIGNDNYTLAEENIDILLKEAYKLERVKYILEEIENRNEKVIIFTKYRKMQEILYKVISKWFNLSPKIINGESPSNKRNDILNDFKSKDGFNVIILSPEAAGVGLNIVEANHVIHYTRHWNPAKEEQATDRAYRIGQKKDVYVYYPIVSYDVKEQEMITFNSQKEWIDAQYNVDTKNKTPEEKLNKVILKKKKLLRDFFLAAITDTTKEDQNEFFSNDFVSDNKSINIITAENILKPKEFEAFCGILIRKEFGGKEYITITSGDRGIDALVINESDIYLIQSKMISNDKPISRKHIDALPNGKDFYKTNLPNTFKNKNIHLLLMTNTDKISKELEENKDIYNTKIYDRKKIISLLNKNDISLNEIYQNKDTYSIELLKSILE